MNPGEWFMIPLGEQFPEHITVWTGQVHARTMVREITRGQALACWRWHGIRGMYFSYSYGNNQWKDVRICGDIDVWFDGSPTDVVTKIDGFTYR